ncbi:MAG: helix-turn-helix domain-containing protein [Acetobacteraceae bacterium]|nr:helix-turn-helix domain-containing protein [Acetobacteraceae bacterium]
MVTRRGGDEADAVGLAMRRDGGDGDAGLRRQPCLASARLDLVRARLETGRPGRVIDIALDAGFGDVAHFNRLFRRRFAMTPSDMLHRGRATA